MRICNPTLKQVIELSKYVRLSGDSPTGLVYRARTGKGRANKRDGEVVGSEKTPGVFKFNVNGQQWYCTAAVRSLQSLGERYHVD